MSIHYVSLDAQDLRIEAEASGLTARQILKTRVKIQFDGPDGVIMARGKSGFNGWYVFLEGDYKALVQAIIAYAAYFNVSSNDTIEMILSILTPAEWRKQYELSAINA